MTALSPLVAAYDHLLLDLDGCVYVGDEATPDAVEALGALRAAGKGVAFVTNEARSTGEEFVRKLWRMGFRASLEEVVTVGGAVQHVLAERELWRSAYVIGAPVIHEHVRAAGLKVVNGRDVPAVPDVVVVAAHDRFDYGELRGAVQAVLGGAALVCAGRDPVFPMPGGTVWPGSGAVVGAVEAATGVTAENLGKPAAQPFLTALDRLGPGRALVVGDRLDGALVLTGSTTAAQARDAADPRPVAVAATLAELVLGRMGAA